MITKLSIGDEFQRENEILRIFDLAFEKASPFDEFAQYMVRYSFGGSNYRSPAVSVLSFINGAGFAPLKKRDDEATLKKIAELVLEHPEGVPFEALYRILMNSGFVTVDNKKGPRFDH